MSERPTTLLARARPSIGAFWISGTMLLTFGWIFFTGLTSPHHAQPQDNGGLVFIVSGVSLIAIACILAMVWTFRAEVRADANGLRWRGLWHGWRECRWDDVRDYYEKLPVPGKPGNTVTSLIIVTRYGKIVCGNYTWKFGTLRRVVETHATKAKTRSWGIWGTRADLDWPITFDYRTGSNPNPITLLLALVCFWVILPARSIIRTVHDVQVLGTGILLCDLGMCGIACLMTGVYSSLFLPILIDTFRHKNDSVTVTQEGLEWKDKVRTVQIKWSDITEYHLDRLTHRFKITPNSVIQTACDQFTFTKEMNDAEVLNRIIQQRASLASTTEWQFKPDDTFEILGGQASRWSSGCAGVGDRVYHYRNRTCRALACFVGLIPSLPLFLEAFYLLGVPVSPPNPWLSVASLGILTYIWWRYTIGGIRTNDKGITQDTPWGNRHIAWDDVQDYRRSGQEGFPLWSVTGSKSKIQFGALITDLEELTAEITRRAVNCPNKTWVTAAAPTKGKLTT